jgi:uncharacterized membrane protein
MRRFVVPALFIGAILLIFGFTLYCMITYEDPSAANILFYAAPFVFWLGWRRW